MLIEYKDRENRETITLKKIVYGEQTRYQVKWERKVTETDIRVDFTELRTYDEARYTFLRFVYHYVFEETGFNTVDPQSPIA